MKNWKYPMKPDGSRDPLSFAYIMLFGSMAGFVFWVPSYPWDIIKTRMQAEDLEKKSNLMSVTRDIYK